MRRLLALGAVIASVVLTLTGCLPAGGGATITGTLSAMYFDITSQVTVTFTRGDNTYTVPVPMVGNYSQIGSFSILNIPAGTYSVEATFETNRNTVIGTTYLVNGGAWVPVDGEVVTGTSSPYTFTITIDSLPASADETIDIYFGDGE